jgi:AcrB/AcrD/AcrF family protein
LIVEFARARQEAGLKRFEAMVEASTLRLRPILMTSFAFILGVLPLVVSTGAGAEGRRLLGTGNLSDGLNQQFAMHTLRTVSFQVHFRCERCSSPNELARARFIRVLGERLDALNAGIA